MKGAAGEEARATMPLRPSERAEVRCSRYKVVVDAEEDRRRREDNMVEIRKSRREESLLKKRRDGLPPSVAAAVAMPQMAHSSALQQKGAIFAFMQFPSASVTGKVLVGVPDLTKYSMGDQLETHYCEFRDVDILKKLAAVSSQLNVGKVADKDTFDHFTSMWVGMKSSLKARENDDSQYYKFRSCIIDIQDIFKGDLLSLSDMDSEGNAVPDNEEKLEHAFFRIMERTVDDDGIVEDIWDLVPESSLKCIITILCDFPGKFVLIGV